MRVSCRWARTETVKIPLEDSLAERMLAWSKEVMGEVVRHGWILDIYFQRRMDRMC